jgi:Peptidase family M23
LAIALVLLALLAAHCASPPTSAVAASAGNAAKYPPPPEGPHPTTPWSPRPTVAPSRTQSPPTPNPDQRADPRATGILRPVGRLLGRPTWTWPLAGRPEIVRAFDPPDAPWGSGHRGIDLAAQVGAPVLAAGSGTVSYAAVLAGRGVVTVAHPNGLRTTYEPILATVHVGDPVSAGDLLGTVTAGHPGCPRVACLHWGLLRGRAYLDPATLLAAGPTRLLPLSGPLPGTTPEPSPTPLTPTPAGRPTPPAAAPATTLFQVSAIVAALALTASAATARPRLT